MLKDFFERVAYSKTNIYLFITICFIVYLHSFDLLLKIRYPEIEKDIKVFKIANLEFEKELLYLCISTKSKYYCEKSKYLFKNRYKDAEETYNKDLYQEMLLFINQDIYILKHSEKDKSLFDSIFDDKKSLFNLSLGFFVIVILIIFIYRDSNKKNENKKHISKFKRK